MSSIAALPGLTRREQSRNSGFGKNVYCTRRSPPKKIKITPKVISPPLTKVQSIPTTRSPPRRSPRNIPAEESPKSPLSTLSPSLKKASMMKPLRQTCGVMRLPIEYVRPDHTNSDDTMPEKLLQNGLFQGHWDNRLKSFYPVDGKTGEIMTPPPSTNPIHSSIIIQPNPVHADNMQGSAISNQTNSLHSAPIINKISSPPMQGSAGVFQSTKIHHAQQGIPISLNIMSSSLAPNLLSNTNHNLSPATVNQLHALLLKSPAKSEPEHPQIQPNCTTLQQPRLTKPIPSKPTAVTQGKPTNPMYIIQGQIPQNMQMGIGRGGQSHNFIQGSAPATGGSNLIQIVSNQTPAHTGGNKILINNSTALSNKEVLLLNPNAIGNTNNGQQQQIKLNTPNATQIIQNRPIIHPIPTSTSSTQQSQISDDSIRKQQLRIEQLKKQLLAAENTKTS
ncbi:hypothetical protein LOD99_7257 [Oopsacas minuta]|uniref:Uncharacterized protein n=1 Tax=Oopsacas minuta TaxID=111878 RepID=A0AAV7JUS9_9METZ|nr:hypothetical protein LOD99_7257 [Oopsacas minuta]